MIYFLGIGSRVRENLEHFFTFLDVANYCGCFADMSWSSDEDEDEDEEDGALAVATIPVESNGSKIIKEVTDKAATDVAKVVEKAMQDKSLKKQVVPDGDSDEEDDEEDSDDVSCSLSVISGFE